MKITTSINRLTLSNFYQSLYYRLELFDLFRCGWRYKITDLSNTNFEGIIFSGTDLSFTNFEKVSFDENCVFDNNIFRDTRFDEEVKPMFLDIGVDTSSVILV